MGEPDIKQYTITVSYAGNDTIKNFLKEGKYDWVDENITDENFPVEETDIGEKEIYFIHFNRTFDNGDQIIEALDKTNFKPKNPAPLLALGMKFPDRQRQFPIAALGQCWLDSCGDRRVVCLDGNLVARRAHLYWFEYRWFANWRFAVVHK